MCLGDGVSGLARRETVTNEQSDTSVSVPISIPPASQPSPGLLPIHLTRLPISVASLSLRLFSPARRPGRRRWVTICKSTTTSTRKAINAIPVTGVIRVTLSHAKSGFGIGRAVRISHDNVSSKNKIIPGDCRSSHELGLEIGLASLLAM